MNNLNSVGKFFVNLIFANRQFSLIEEISFQNDPLFSKKVVEQMENYLNLITIVNLELGTEVVQFFLENKEHWCSQFHSADDWVVLR